MDTDPRPANAYAPNAPQSDVHVADLASTVAFAAAGSLLAYSLFTAKRSRLTITCQLGLGALVAFAGVVSWKSRQQQLAAARHLVDNVNHARDARWLRKNPIAYA